MSLPRPGKDPSMPLTSHGSHDWAPSWFYSGVCAPCSLPPLHLLCFAPNCTRSTRSCLCWWSSPRPFSRARGQMLSGPGSNSIAGRCQDEDNRKLCPICRPLTSGQQSLEAESTDFNCLGLYPDKHWLYLSVLKFVPSQTEWLHLPKELWGLGKWI